MRPYHAMLIQETNLRESRAMYAFCAYAERFHKMLVLSSPIPRDAPVGTRGGTAIIIPVESIEKESKNETDREACARVRARHEQTADGRLAPRLSGDPGQGDAPGGEGSLYPPV